MEETAFPRAQQMHTSRKPKAILILIGVLLILGVLVYGGMRFLGSGSDDMSEDGDVLPTAVIAPSSTPSPTGGSEEPSPTEEDKDEDDEPTPTRSNSSGSSLDRSSLSVQVLNGSGVSGAAGEVKSVLEDLGYTNVTTGNADSFEYEDISISVKSTKSNFLKQLQTDLSDSYTIGDTDSDLTSSEYDAVVIIGQ